LGKDNISRNGFDSEFRRYRDIGFRDGEIEYENEEREGSDKSHDEEKYIGILSYFLVFIEDRFLFGKKQNLRKKFLHLVAGVFPESEIVTENMPFRVLLFEFDIVVFLKKPDSEGFSESFEFGVVRDERESFHRETIEKELEIQIVAERGIFLDLHLDFSRFHSGDFLEYLRE